MIELETNLAVDKIVKGYFAGEDLKKLISSASKDDSSRLVTESSTN